MYLSMVQAPKNRIIRALLVDELVRSYFSSWELKSNYEETSTAVFLI